MIKTVKVSSLRANPNNPRVIRDDKFKQLVNSIKEAPWMLKIRPIVVNDDNVVLGGNMRLKACIEVGLKEVPIIKASELTEAQQKEFIIKDNVGYGQWDWDVLADEWNTEDLNSWGLEVWELPDEVDYSVLDDDDLEENLTDMEGEVKKAIQIEFDIKDYDEAYELIKFWREQKLYIGGFIIEKLKQEKDKI